MQRELYRSAIELLQREVLPVDVLAAGSLVCATEIEIESATLAKCANIRDVGDCVAAKQTLKS